MENVYGIGTANRYALFLDEDADPLDILKQSEAEKLTAKAKKLEDATKPVAKTVKKVANNQTEDKENQRNNAGGRFEGKRVVDARKAQGGEVREERNNQRNEGQVRRDDDGSRRDDGGRGRGRGPVNCSIFRHHFPEPVVTIQVHHCIHRYILLR